MQALVFRLSGRGAGAVHSFQVQDTLTRLMVVKRSILHFVIDDRPTVNMDPPTSNGNVAAAKPLRSSVRPAQ